MIVWPVMLHVAYEFDELLGIAADRPAALRLIAEHCRDFSLGRSRTEEVPFNRPGLERWVRSGSETVTFWPEQVKE